MILTRLGNKQKLAEAIYNHLPPHKLRVDMFFGAGGLFFYMPQAKYNILNDFDDDVTNLYLIVLNRKNEFIKMLQQFPISSSLIKYWKKNKETDPLKKAVRFLLLSNFTYLGKGDTLRLGIDNTKKILLKNIDPTFKMLQNAKITSNDFREVLSKISFSEKVTSKDDTHLLLDPVYYDTEHYYNVPKWTKNETLDCFDIMQNSGITATMCEFNHPFIINEAKKRDLNIIYLKERQNIKNRKIEILITNYDNPQLKFKL